MGVAVRTYFTLLLSWPATRCNCLPLPLMRFWFGHRMAQRTSSMFDCRLPVSFTLSAHLIQAAFTLSKHRWPGQRPLVSIGRQGPRKSHSPASHASAVLSCLIPGTSIQASPTWRLACLNICFRPTSLITISLYCTSAPLAAFPLSLFAHFHTLPTRQNSIRLGGYGNLWSASWVFSPLTAVRRCLAYLRRG